MPNNRFLKLLLSYASWHTVVSRLLGLLLVCSVTFLYSCGKPPEGESANSPEYEYSPEYEGESANSPTIEEPPDEIPSSPSSSPSSSPLSGTAMTAIEKAIEKLPIGEVYHNVPERMKVGVSTDIEAGIAPEVTEQIKEKIQGNEEITVESGVKFDPKGMDMNLIVSEDDFKVKKRGKVQFVSNESPGKWRWSVTPLKSGKKRIAIEATIVELEVTDINRTRERDISVFSDTREIDVNLGYSVSQFLFNNWQEVSGLMFGSGSLAVLLVGGLESDKVKSF